MNTIKNEINELNMSDLTELYEYIESLKNIKSVESTRQMCKDIIHDMNADLDPDFVDNIYDKLENYLTLYSYKPDPDAWHCYEDGTTNELLYKVKNYDHPIHVVVTEHSSKHTYTRKFQISLKFNNGKMSYFGHAIGHYPYLDTPKDSELFGLSILHENGIEVNSESYLCLLFFLLQDLWDDIGADDELTTCIEEILCDEGFLKDEE